MQSIYSAFAWHFCRRHVTAYAVIAMTTFFISAIIQFGIGQNVDRVSAGLLSSLPIIQLSYLIAIFGFGCDTDLFGSESSYPQFIQRLPVSTRFLASMPLVCGAFTIVALWFVIRFVVMLPTARLLGTAEFGPSPMLTPMVFIATLALLQSVLWTSFRHASLRIVAVLVAMVGPVVTVAILGSNGYTTRTLAIGLLMTTLIGYGLSLLTMQWSRHGVFFGPTSFPGIGLSIPSLGLNRGIRPRPDFRSSLSAQVWYEWRRYQLPLVSVVVIGILACGVPLLLWPDQVYLYPFMFFMPLTVCAFGSLGLGGLNHRSSDRNVSPFFAAQPMSTFDYIRAKWLATAFSSILIFVVNVAVIGLAIWISQEKDWFSGRWVNVTKDLNSTQQAIAIGLIAMTYPIMLWVLLVQPLSIKLAGRYWVESVVLMVFIFFGGQFFAALNVDWPELVPWTIGTLLALKVLLAFALCYKLRAARILSSEAISFGLFVWGSLVVGWLAWFHSLNIPFGSHTSLLLFGFAIFGLPINRLALAPLALHWNRHR